jgi:flagellar biosynthesis protein FlhB
MPGERTEQATQHRREKARKEGDILHSRELTAAAGTLAGVMALGALGGRTMSLARRVCRGFCSGHRPRIGSRPRLSRRSSRCAG